MTTTIEPSTEVSEQQKRLAAAQEKADQFASQLRRMADWLEVHPEATAQLMSASVGLNQRPAIKLYKVSALKQAFPGCAAEKRQFSESDVYSLEHEGITFEAWQTSRPPMPEREQVTL